MPLPSPSITIVNEWPAVLGHREAAAYIGESTTQLDRIARLYPNKLRTFNLLPNGETKFRRDDLDAFLDWRSRSGLRGGRRDPEYSYLVGCVCRNGLDSVQIRKRGK